jgi:hypothetical protein
LEWGLLGRFARVESQDILGVAAEDFGDGDGAGEGAAGAVGGVAVEEFGELADAVGVEMAEASVEDLADVEDRGGLAAVEAKVGGGVWGEEPGVDGALVLGAVAGDDAAGVLALVV